MKYLKKTASQYTALLPLDSLFLLGIESPLHFHHCFYTALFSFFPECIAIFFLKKVSIFQKERPCWIFLRASRAKAAQNLTTSWSLVSYFVLICSRESVRLHSTFMDWLLPGVSAEDSTKRKATSLWEWAFDAVSVFQVSSDHWNSLFCPFYCICKWWPNPGPAQALLLMVVWD